ncbi:MAG: GT2 family glycosyltransferase [Gammaproteobacteria bacterium]|jgi:GT2 family glycosyltransferase
MDYKYLQLRIQTFRREYIDNTSHWLKSSWSWIWSFTIDNVKYLYSGEINQIKYLCNTIKQQNDYIDFIQSNPTTNNKKTGIQPIETTKVVEKLIKNIFLIFLLPLSFLVYWIRRLIRIILGKQCKLKISDTSITESNPLKSDYQEHSYLLKLIPEDSNIFPRGLVLFRYSVTATDENLEPYLYIDPGVGYTSEYTIPLPYNKNLMDQEILIELPPHCTSLKLEFVSKETELNLNDIAIKETNFFHAAWYLNTKFNYGMNEILHALFIRKLPGVRRPRSEKSSYSTWNRLYSHLSSEDKNAINKHIDAFINPPLFSVVINIDNQHPELLDLCIKSLILQLYPQWELLVTCKQPPDTHVTSVLNKYERYDKRIRILINNESAKILDNIPEALKQSKGQYAIFIEYQDLLSEHALYLYACYIQKNNQLKLIYSDYDHINQYGKMFEPCFKPDWNYDFFLGKNYLQYLVCYQSECLMTAINAGVTNPFIQSSQLHLLLTERKLDSLEVSHIPYVLLHHRKLDYDSKGESDINLQHDIDALKVHLQRTKQLATASLVKAGIWIKRDVPNPQPLISLIVLTRDRVALLSNCIHGLLEKTAYKNIEIIIIDNGSIEEATLSYLNSIIKNGRIKVLRQDSEFNFSELNNIAVENSNGEYIGLINNDISVIEPNWLDEMMGHIIRADVGVVGAKLLYENDTIQHAGVIIGLGGVAGHNFRYEPGYARGYDDRLVLCQELSCVTAACLLTKKSVYKKVDGLDAVNVRIAFNDVDFSLKVKALGLKVIWTPFAELYHLESASRGSDLSKENIHRWNAEYMFMRNKWKHVLERDPFYNPNLTITDEDFSLAHPPRLIHPWDSDNYIINKRE